MNLNLYKKTASVRSLALACMMAGTLGAALCPVTAAAQVAVSELAAKAPSRYTVVKGDTLWAIAGHFLNAPSKWPQIWNLNKDQISNPHLIYPGDVIRLDIVNGQARLSLERGRRQEIRLSPGVRFEDVGNDAIPTISPTAIRPFLTKPMLVDVEQFSSAPRIVSNEDGRLNVGAGSKTYVTGPLGGPGSEYAVYRQGPALIDPETKETLAIEAIYIGRVRVVRLGETSLTEVIESTQELGRGDRLVPLPEQADLQVALSPAPVGFEGRIIKVYDSQTASMFGSRIESVRNYEREGGPLSVIILNKGTQAGLAVGQVVQTESSGRLINERNSLGYRNGNKADPAIQLPNEINGSAVVFKAFEKVSYALVMKASKSVLAGDVIKAPER